MSSTKPPVACTLSPADLQTRLADLRALSQTALLSARREDLTLHLRYIPAAAEQVRRMVEKEKACCAFLHFRLDSQPQGLDLRITAPEEARHSIEHIYEQFLQP